MSKLWMKQILMGHHWNPNHLNGTAVKSAQDDYEGRPVRREKKTWWKRDMERFRWEWSTRLSEPQLRLKIARLAPGHGLIIRFSHQGPTRSRTRRAGAHAVAMYRVSHSPHLFFFNPGNGLYGIRGNAVNPNAMALAIIDHFKLIYRECGNYGTMKYST